jgi:hypothetical protein
MHYSLGDEYYISGLKVIYLVFYKITAGALGNKIYFKMIVAMLAHSMSSHALYVTVSIIKKLTLAVNILVFHKNPPVKAKKLSL